MVMVNDDGSGQISLTVKAVSEAANKNQLVMLVPQGSMIVFPQVSD